MRGGGECGGEGGRGGASACERSSEQCERVIVRERDRVRLSARERQSK